MVMNNVKFMTLDNGLRVLLYSDKSKSVNHVELVTFYGGNNSKYLDKNGIEKEIYSGTAHYLEHYVCERSKYGNYLTNMQKYKVLAQCETIRSNSSSLSAAPCLPTTAAELTAAIYSDSFRSLPIMSHAIIVPT